MYSTSTRPNLTCLTITFSAGHFKNKKKMEKDGVPSSEEIQEMLTELNDREAMAKENQKFVCEFIELYRDLPCLWKYNCKDYRNRNVKSSAYDALVSKMKEADPRADRNSVMRKINALRTAFRREYKKVRHSMLMAKTVPGSTKRYLSSLWYYDLIKFVVEKQDSDTIPPGVALTEWHEDRTDETYEESDEEGEQDDEAMNGYFEDPKIHEPSIKLEPLSPSTSFGGSSPTEPTATSTSGPTLNLEINSVYSEKDATIDLSTREQPPLKRPRRNEAFTATDLDRFGSYVATKLKKSSKKQSIIAEKVIAEVLMRANLGTLDESTTLTEAKTDMGVA